MGFRNQKTVSTRQGIRGVGSERLCQQRRGSRGRAEWRRQTKTGRPVGEYCDLLRVREKGKRVREAFDPREMTCALALPGHSGASERENALWWAH